MTNNSISHGIRYRPDIDGLRALAVLPVILFHAGFGPFSGGFVGVDVFFVISGYLITRNIVMDLDRGTFSLLDFYDRRARRILPALFMVMLACIPFAWFWMLPDPFENFGQSLVATTLFSNNILLYLTSSYWELSAEFKPLLHTWSLGIEEQYYVVIPLLVMALFKLRRSWLGIVLTALALLSLFMAEYALRTDPVGAFYLIPFRAWELLVGAITALYAEKWGQERTNRGVADTAVSMGLALIIGATLLFDRSTPIPGIHILVPTLGTALIVFFGQNSRIAARALGNRLIVAIGVVSYSAYLWHQAVFALQRVYLPSEPVLWERFAALVVISALSYLTWKFVEVPCRRRTIVKARPFWAAVTLVAVSIVGFSLAVHFSHGFPGRIFQDNKAIIDDIHISYNDRVFEFERNDFITEKPVKVLVVGNSFARDFVNMMLEALDTSRMEIIYAVDLEECRDTAGQLLDRKLFNATTIVVTASKTRHNCSSKLIAFADSLGKKLMFVGTKHFGYNLNWLARLDESARKNRTNKLMVKTIREERAERETTPPDHYLSLLDAFTDMKNVPITDADGNFLTPDRAHLTRAGARYVGKRTLDTTRMREFFDQ